MKKMTVGILTALLVVCFSAVGFARHGGGHYEGKGHGKHRGAKQGGYHAFVKREPLTEQQKNDMFNYMTEKNKLRAEYLSNEVKEGRMSQKTADAHITLMSDRLQKVKESNFERPVFSEQEKAAKMEYCRKMKNLKQDGYHKHIKKEYMTTQQKSDILNYMTEKNKLKAEYLNNEVKEGRMNRKVADAHITLMNDRLQKVKESNFERPVFSEQEKAAKMEYAKKMKNLRIDHINKCMASGSISQEQGQKMLEKLEKFNSDGNGHFHGRPVRR